MTTILSSLKNRQNLVVIICIALFSGASVITKGPALAFILSFIAALVILAMRVKHTESKPNYAVPCALAGIFVLTIPHFINDGFYPSSLDTPSRYLLGAIIFLALQHYTLKLKVLEYSIIAGAAGCFITAVYQISQGATRIEGTIGIISFGFLASTFAVYCYILFLHEIENRSKVFLSLAAIATALAIYASISTGTRGAWLGFIAGFPALYLFYLFRINATKYKIIAAVPLFTMALLFLSPQVQHRFEEGTSDLDSYQVTQENTVTAPSKTLPENSLQVAHEKTVTAQSKAIPDNSLQRKKRLTKAEKIQRKKNKAQGKKLQHNSIGLRVELMKLAMKEFTQAPVFGLGYKKREEYRKKLIAEGELDRVIGHDGTGSSHNELLTLISQKGIVGLVILIILYSLPVYLAGGLSSLKNPTTCSQLLLATTALYIIYGLTEAPLMGKDHAMLYCLSLLMFFLAKKNENKQPILS